LHGLPRPISMKSDAIRKRSMYDTQCGGIPSKQASVDIPRQHETIPSPLLQTRRLKSLMITVKMSRVLHRSRPSEPFLQDEHGRSGATTNRSLRRCATLPAEAFAPEQKGNGYTISDITMSDSHALTTYACTVPSQVMFYFFSCEPILMCVIAVACLFHSSHCGRR
jgi:hypothetical protein